MTQFACHGRTLAVPVLVGFPAQVPGLVCYH